MPPENLAIDPVCGMKVDPATAPAKTTHDGTTYYFCCTHCLHKFEADPQKYLHGPPEPMTLAFKSDTAPAAGTKRQYICPMDPEVLSDRPGACPKCGMALEPKDVAADDEADPEHALLVWKFWIALALTAPIWILSMLLMAPNHDILEPRLNGSIQALLTTLVLGYSGAILYQRAWTALLLGHLNMFTLIVLGVSTAFVYSTLARIWPGLFATDPGHHGPLHLYYESAATIVVLVLLGQVLEGRARHATTAAVRKLAGLAPKSARVVLPDGREQDLPLELIQPGAEWAPGCAAPRRHGERSGRAVSPPRLFRSAPTTCRCCLASPPRPCCRLPCPPASARR